MEIEDHLVALKGIEILLKICEVMYMSTALNFKLIF